MSHEMVSCRNHGYFRPREPNLHIIVFVVVTTTTIVTTYISTYLTVIRIITIFTQITPKYFGIRIDTIRYINI
jgi:hypothetical protein